MKVTSCQKLIIMAKNKSQKSQDVSERVRKKLCDSKNVGKIADVCKKIG